MQLSEGFISKKVMTDLKKNYYVITIGLDKLNDIINVITIMEGEAMSKKLIAYFSASGTTKKRAEKLAEISQADLYEIKPVAAYSKEDLNWMNPNSRSSVEMKDKSFRPEIIKDGFDPAPYDVIFLGFPIWWYVAPTIINTFLESYNFSGKKIILFATSGSSGFGNTLEELKISALNAEMIEGRMLNGLNLDKKMNELLNLE